MLEINCPYCSYPLLKHLRSTGVYWYCSHCHQEMSPNLLGLWELNQKKNSVSLENWRAAQKVKFLILEK